MDRTRRSQTLSPSQSGLSTQGQGTRDSQMQMQHTKKRRSKNILIDLSIGTRLTLGFITAALIAAIAAGTIGFQQTQSLYRQSDFYQSLLKANTKLTTSAQYLQLMRSETQTLLDQLNSSSVSQETMNNDISALNNLNKQYNDILTGYLSNDLINKHQDQVDLLDIANHKDQVNQQNTLASSTLRSWRVYQNALNQEIKLIQNNQADAAFTLQQSQVEPTNSDALSSARALIQFNGRIARSVQDAADVENQSQRVSTIVWSIIAFIGILLIGWIISGTIVRRLRTLRQVTQAVEQGQINRRVIVTGSDEIADVSSSVNAMLEAITGLLAETQHQRDALTNAAEHLFSDMRVVSAGDLRINAPVSSDPIGMLANAFNFTVGRFRRFVQRTKATAEQLDVIAHQEVERSEAFTQALFNTKTGPLSILGSSILNTDGATRLSSPGLPNEDPFESVMNQLYSTREHLQQITNDGLINQNRTINTLSEQISASVERLNRLQAPFNTSSIRQEEIRMRHAQEIRALEGLLTGVLAEAQNIQKNTSRSFQELDRELLQLSMVARTQKSKSPSENIAATPRMMREALQEITRLSTGYTNEITTVARQINTMAQEIRNGIITFQLDTVENSGNSLPSVPMTPTNNFNNSFPGIGTGTDWRSTGPSSPNQGRTTSPNQGRTTSPNQGRTTSPNQGRATSPNQQGFNSFTGFKEWH